MNKINDSLKYFDQLTKRCDAIGTLIVRAAQYPEEKNLFSEFEYTEIEITALLEQIKNTLFNRRNND